MTAGHPSSRPGPPQNNTAREWFAHASAPRVNTDAVIVNSLRAEYPNLHLTVVPTSSCNLLAYAAAGRAGVAPIDNEKDRVSWRVYLPPATRLNGSQGVLSDTIKFGKYLVDWRRKEFVVFVVEGRDGDGYFPILVNQYILSPSVEATNELVLEAGKWTSELHGEIWVFDGGYWQKSAELYDSMKKARWEDVILEKNVKDAIIGDYDNFFSSRETYEQLRVPWKRGIILFGPPGNGKTISIKAMMHSLYQRTPVVPTLYVRTLASYMGPEGSLAAIFELARREAPCLLVFEDLDSLITDSVRSYFLNEVDGIRKNDGILIIGSTNHIDRLDPGIRNRPSRFDRLHEFPNPNEEQRTAYLKYWQGKLADNKDLDFPDKLCPAVAKITDKFSFAYIQEAIIASLLIIARDREQQQQQCGERFCLECMDAHAKPAAGGTCDRASVRPFRGLYEFTRAVQRVEDDGGDSDGDLDDYVLWRVIKKQVRLLREQMGDDETARRRL